MGLQKTTELKKRYKKFYEKYKAKGQALIPDRKRISNIIRKTRSKIEKLKNIPKFKKLSMQLCDLCDMVSDYLDGDYENFPLATVVALLGGLIYLTVPFDAIVDFIPFLGFIDDAAVIAFVVNSEQYDVNKYLEWKNGGEQ